MDKNKLKFFLDFFILVLFLISLVSGIVLWIKFPSGSGRAGVFIFTRFIWLKIHFFSSIVFSVLLIIHLLLNFNWVKAMFRNIFIKG